MDEYDYAGVGGGWTPSSSNSDLVEYDYAGVGGGWTPDDSDNIDAGGGWNPGDVPADPEYSNEGKNYPTPESTQGPGGSPVNSSISDPSGLLTKLLGQLKSLYSSNGQLDMAKALPLIAGLASAARSDSRTQPSGYQGGIPRYTAVRQAPGAGQRLSGNVLFTRPDNTQVNPGILGAATGVKLPSDTAAPTAGYRGDAAPSYLNDPEYIRLRDAVTAVRGGGGGTMTMDYKPEEQALNDYIRRQNPTFMADRENAMGRAATEAGAPASAYVAQPQPESTGLAGGGTLRSGGFVIPADVVSHFGNGSSDAGLKLLASKLGATPIKGRGDGMSDSIPTTIDGTQQARVAHEEAYMSPEKVARLGGGDAAKGAKKLRDMMEQIRKARTGTTEQGKQINPGKFMPGGSVQHYVTGGTTAPGTSAASAGITGTESNLSNWAGPYVTDMLAKGQALSEMPYEAYTGQLTAGPSDLQSKTFTGLQNVNFPGNLGATFSSTGAYQLPSLATGAYNTSPIGTGGPTEAGGVMPPAASTAPTGIAAQYMNPYLQAVLDPQLAELRRQAQVNAQSGLGALTKSGAFGGGRQAIMEAEASRNLLQEQNKAIGQGYANAYDKAMGQFNTEQGQAKTLVDLLSTQGATQRGIESEAIAADKKQFEEARENPYKMVQFQQSLLKGLPLEAQTYNQAPTNDFTQFASGLTTLKAAMDALGIK